MRINLLPVLLLLVLFRLTPPAYADDPIRVGVYQNRPLLWMDSSDQPQGIFIDVIDSIASQNGWRIEYISCNWPECLALLQTGELDLLPAIGYSGARAEQYDFTRENVLTTWAQVYTQRNSQIQSFLDLEGKRISVLKDDIHYVQLARLLEQFEVDAEFVEVDHYAIVLQLVEEEQTDAGVTNRFFGAQFESDYRIEKSPIIFDPTENRFAAPKGQNQDLLEAIDMQLADLKHDPTSIYHQSLNRWLEGANSEAVFPQWVPWVLLSAGGLLILFVALNLILRAQIRRRTAELAKSETRYRTLFEDAPLGIISFDREGVITAVNPALLEILGSPSREDTMSFNLLTFPLLTEAGISALIRRCLETGERIIAENLLTTVWEKTAYLRCHSRPSVMQPER